MTDWFQDAFRGHYLSLYSHRDEAEALDTVALITGVLALRPGTRVLDAPCGAGRHARGFASLGHVVSGLDLSRDLLEAARRADQERGRSKPMMPASPVGYTRSDLRAIPFPDRQFDLVTNLFSSFGYFASDEENQSALNELARVVKGGGHMVLDFFNASRVRQDLNPASERRTTDGLLVRERREIRGFPPRVEKHVRIESTDGEAQEITESVRLYDSEELEQMMATAGVPVCRRFGDYSGAPLNPQSPRVILFGRKAA